MITCYDCVEPRPRKGFTPTIVALDVSVLHCITLSLIFNCFVYDTDECGVDVNTDVELETIPLQCQLPPNVHQQTQVKH